MKKIDKLKVKLLTEQIEKISGKKVMFEEGKYTNQLSATGINFDTDLEFVSADHRDIGGLADSFANSLSKFGVYCYQDPSLEGSDTLGFIISKKPLNKKQANWAAKALFEEGKYSNKKVLKEGTQALPKNTEEYVKARKLLTELGKFKRKAYNIFGDDEFFDGLDAAYRRGIELMKIAQDKYPEIKQKS